ncbi:intermembrane phospholipid transport protein YdbH family protein, partial [Aestuariibaculum lutulentum]
LSTTLQFTDLLNLESAPGQVATIKSVNPGVAANDGTIRYQTLPGNRVRIEGGEWPFAGGRRTLLPTLLDFSTDQVRRMTFRIRGAAADQFL